MVVNEATNLVERNMRLAQIVFSIGLLIASISTPGRADDAYPSRPVKIVVPFPPGATTDIFGRVLADWIQRRTQKTAIVENRGGAGGNIGTDVVAKSQRDGYTLGIVSSMILAANPFIYSAMPYDPIKDLTPIATLGQAPPVLVVRSDLPASNLAEFIALAKSEPSKLTYGSAGAGTPQHLFVEVLARRAGVSLTHVPYRGVALALTDLLGRRVDAMFLTLSGGIGPFIENGQLRALAVGSKTRLPALPDVPTVEEAGLGDFSIPIRFGVVAPAGVSKDVISTISLMVKELLADAEVRKRLQEIHIEPLQMTPEEFSAMIRADYEQWKTVIPSLGLQPE